MILRRKQLRFYSVLLQQESNNFVAHSHASCVYVTGIIYESAEIARESGKRKELYTKAMERERGIVEGNRKSLSD